MKRVVIIIFIVAIGISCEKINDDDVRQVKYGTSFGMCYGYCKHDILIRPGLIMYSRSGWSDTVETLTYIEALPDSSWNFYRSGIDAGMFFNLPQTIGCPDCADGGAEWLEIELSSGKKHKVTFEYLNEPEELEDYVEELRKQMGRSGECGD